MNTDLIVNFLRTIPVLHGLPIDDVQRLSQATSQRDYAAGDVVLERDASGDSLFVILQGEFQVYLHDDQIGVEREIANMYPGDYFGDISVISGYRHVASVRALTDGRLLTLGKDAIDALFDESPAFARQMCQSMARYLAENSGKIAGVPFVTLNSYPDLKKLSEMLPHRIARFCQCLVVERDHDRVTVACTQPSDARMRAFVSEALKEYRIQWAAVDADDFARRAAELLKDDDDPALQGDFDEFVMSSPSGERVLVRGEDAADDPLAKALQEAIMAGASDLHFEPTGNGGRVRMRLDGLLMNVGSVVDAEHFKQILSRIKLLANLNITRVARPQDGRFHVEAGDQTYEFRVSTTPCVGGDKAVLRIVSPRPKFQQLGGLILAPALADFVREMLLSPSGLILVTGPTGAGKTTTLYAALRSIWEQNQAINIVTIEDPVEYTLDFATQIPVSDNTDMSFASILRTVLRQDPDVIMVGEIRDEASATAAVEAATTGHLVLSSLHTHSALETISRLRKLGVPPYLLADALRGVVSQRLLPRLAPGCTQPVPADSPSIAELKQLSVLPHDWSGELVAGCETPDGPPNGEEGRVGMYEVLYVTDAVRRMIDADSSTSQMANALDGESFSSFRQYCRFLLEQGLISPARAARAFPKKSMTMADAL